MARGFGTTYGVGTTDIITTTLTAAAAQRSWSIWFNRPADVSASLGRFWSKGTATITEQLYWNNDGNIFGFEGARVTTGGGWSIVEPTNNAWHHLLVTYDNGSTSNDPVFYLDGASVSVTEYYLPAGAVISNSEAYTVGNRATDSGRVFPGHLAEFAVWNSILTLANAQALAAGYSALGIASATLAAYFPIRGTASPEPSLVGGYTGTVTGTLATAHPNVNYPVTISGLLNGGQLFDLARGGLIG